MFVILYFLSKAANYIVLNYNSNDKLDLFSVWCGWMDLQVTVDNFIVSIV